LIAIQIESAIVRPMKGQLDFLEDVIHTGGRRTVAIKAMSRNTDPDTSVQAAVSVIAGLSNLQEKVLRAFRDNGEMTAHECELLPQFWNLSASTVRKRISELSHLGKLVDTGERREGMTVWRIGQ